MKREEHTLAEHRRAAGAIGENLVADFFPFAHKTDDWYDRVKDGFIGNLRYEVKTLRLNKKYQGFWIAENQFQKLDNVDVLIIVNIPETADEQAILYLFNNHKNENSYYQFKYNAKSMRNYKLINCIALCIINKETSKELYEHSKKMRTYE